MHRTLLLVVLLLTVLTLTLTVPCANSTLAKEEGGYYESLAHPDFGQASARDSGYHQGEGYYGKAIVEPNAVGTQSLPADRTAADSPPPPVVPAAVPVDLTPVTKVEPARAPTAAYAMEEGKRMWSQGAYHAAEEAFQAACARDPQNQLAHYMLALTRMHLYDSDGAKEQMQMAFALGPFSEIGQKARASILDLSQFINRENRPPVDKPEQLQQTVQDMGRQAASLKAQKALDGARASYWAQYSGQAQAWKIRNEYGDYFSGRGRLRRIYAGDRYDVSNLATIKSNYALSDSYVRGAAARRDAAERQRSIQEYMNSALSLMGDEPRTGEPHLRAFGTNLYVRYYGTDTPDSPPETVPDDPALKATAGVYQKIIPASHKSSR